MPDQVRYLVTVDGTAGSVLKVEHLDSSARLIEISSEGAKDLLEKVVSVWLAKTAVSLAPPPKDHPKEPQGPQPPSAPPPPEGDEPGKKPPLPPKPPRGEPPPAGPIPPGPPSPAAPRKAN